MKELSVTVKHMSNWHSETTEGVVPVESARNVLKVLQENDGEVLFSAHNLNVGKITGRKDPLVNLEIPREQKDAVRKGNITIGMMLESQTGEMTVQIHEIGSDIAERV